MDQQLKVVTDLLLQTADPEAGDAILDFGCGYEEEWLRPVAEAPTS